MQTNSVEKNNISSHVIGDKGENRACSYLESKGYRILFRNYRTKKGEVDIIAEYQEFIVFVEVKTLPSGNIDTLSWELNKRKQQRIIETTKFFLSNYRQYNNRKIRFDVLVIDMPGFDPVYHIPNAFSEIV